MSDLDLLGELNRAAVTTGLGFNAVCNALAGTTGLDGVGALNVKAGTTGLELEGVLNQLAGTTGRGSQAAARLIYRTNLIKYPSAESGATGWTGTDSPGMTFASSSSQSYSGTKSYECTSSASGVMDRYCLHTEGSAATPGATYTGSVYVRAASTTADAYATLIFWNSGGGFISATNGAVSADSSTAWGRRTVTATAPAGTAFVTLGIIWTVAAAGEVHYLDAAMIEATSTVGTYFDGSTPNCRWTGTAHASTSQSY